MHAICVAVLLSEQSFTFCCLAKMCVRTRNKKFYSVYENGVVYTGATDVRRTGYYFVTLSGIVAHLQRENEKKKTPNNLTREIFTDVEKLISITIGIFLNIKTIFFVLNSLKRVFFYISSLA